MVAVPGEVWPALGYEERTWTPDLSNRGPRADRLLGHYRSATVPAIAALIPSLGSATREAMRAVEEAVRPLQTRSGLPDLGALTGALLRSESVASSKIEHLTARQDEVALAAFGVSARSSDGKPGAAPRAVAANIAAMSQAVNSGRGPVTLEDLRGIHATLMQNDPYEAAEAGRVRTVQNWIGGSDYSPRDALFVPPHHEHLEAGLRDLVAFFNRTDLSPVALGAIAHAHFETLHPFVDGNGRTGRALIHLLWRRTGLAPHVVLPVSTVLLADVNSYFAGLGAYRAGDVDAWVSQFAIAAARASVAATNLASQVADLRRTWASEVKARANSAVATLLQQALVTPVMDVHKARAHIEVDDANLYRALDRLTAAGVLQEVTGERRNRIWFAPDVFELLEQFERDLGRRARPAV